MGFLFIHMLLFGFDLIFSLLRTKNMWPAWTFERTFFVWESFILFQGFLLLPPLTKGRLNEKLWVRKTLEVGFWRCLLYWLVFFCVLVISLGCRPRINSSCRKNKRTYGCWVWEKPKYLFILVFGIWYDICVRWDLPSCSTFLNIRWCWQMLSAKMLTYHWQFFLYWYVMG